MALTKAECKLIWELNSTYDKLFNKYIKSWNTDYFQKMKLLRVLTKNIEEQARWFLKKNKVHYKKWALFFLSEFENLKYKDLHKEVTNILLDL